MILFISFLPLLISVSFLIFLLDGAPVFYFGKRVKTDFNTFNLIKFRTMVKNSEDSKALTKGSNDPRITRLGKIIRRYKIDELPQLINVIKGEISLVGYRPESPNIAKLEIFHKLKNKKPGITDWSSLFFINEEEILESVVEKEKFYIQKIVPQKIKLNFIFYGNRTIKNYFKILFYTITSVLINKETPKKYLIKTYPKLINPIFKND